MTIDRDSKNTSNHDNRQFMWSKRVIPRHISCIMESLLFALNVQFQCLFSFTAVKSRIECVEILLIQAILHDAEGFTETGGLK